MSHRLLKEGILDKFFSLFLRAKADNKEQQLLSRLKTDDPEMAAIWSDWDDHVNQMMKRQSAALKKAGIDSSDTDALIKKYYK
jgi:hypothetical protein